LSTPLPPSVLTTTRDPVRRVLHVLLAAGGWILFGYTWWVVFRPGLDGGALWIFAGIAVGFALIALANQLWVLHNLSIFRTRPRRRQVRAVDVVVSRDALGRTLEVDWPLIRAAARIRIDIPAEDRKVYASGDPRPTGTLALPESPLHPRPLQTRPARTEPRLGSDPNEPLRSDPWSERSEAGPGSSPSVETRPIRTPEEPE
jgi:hypothetical protein